MKGAESQLRVRVVHAAADAQYQRELTVAAGTTVAAAIQISGIAKAVDLKESEVAHVGIFGRSVAPDTVLRDGDRVEIYRELKIDPREARRRRAAKR